MEGGTQHGLNLKRKRCVAPSVTRKGEGGGEKRVPPLAPGGLEKKGERSLPISITLLYPALNR